ncbi:MAG: ATP-binding cassette domain-containing protein [bacterium]|nr:ATP-binding cassette domain-containing protein [bacterium]
MIAVTDLEFTYPKRREPALKKLNFSIEKGEIFGFLGPSGAGKSTAQKVLTGLLTRYRGTVKVMGRELSQWGRGYYERIGVGFEYPNHYLKLTARENLEYFRSLYAGPVEDSMALLDRVGLTADADTRVSQFSKGMKSRLNFVRALINRPELVFLDEPTSGLDPVNARVVKDMILELRDQGKTIFLTTHNMNVADELCGRVAFIVDGELPLIDSPRALKLRGGERTVRVEYHEGGELLHESFSLDRLGYCIEFQALLREKPIETIHTLESTLEQVFIQVTGRSLT